MANLDRSFIPSVVSAIQIIHRHDRHHPGWRHWYRRSNCTWSSRHRDRKPPPIAPCRNG